MQVAARCNSQLASLGGLDKRAGVIALLPRPAAIVFALLLAALSIWCLIAKPPPISVAKKGGYTDVRLYHDMAKEVAKGTPYHQAAAQLHRAHHYPLKPFVTMRPPTLVVVAANIGWRNLQLLAQALLMLGLFAWVVAFEGQLHWTERVLVAIAFSAGGGFVMNEGLLALHEYWAGLFMALGLAGVVGWPRKWGLIVLPIAAGLLVRELVVPFALLALAFAVVEKRAGQAAAWAAVLAAFGAFMAFHAQEVAAQLHPGDISSPGWHAGQGFSAFLKAVIFTSTLGPLPRPLALFLAMLPLLGWLALPGRAGLFSQLLVAGYVVMISAFSRPDTFYWGAIMLPWYFVGYALLPRAFWQLAGAIRR